MAKRGVKKKAQATRKPAKPAQRPAAKRSSAAGANNAKKKPAAAKKPKPAARPAKKRAPAPRAGVAKAKGSAAKRPSAPKKKSTVAKSVKRAGSARKPAKPAKPAKARAARKTASSLIAKPAGRAKPKAAAPAPAQSVAKAARPLEPRRPVAKAKPARPAAAPHGSVPTPSVTVAPKAFVVPPSGLKPLRIRAKAAPPAARAIASAGPPMDVETVLARLRAKKQEIQALYVNDLRSGQESNDSPTEDIVDRANNSYSRELNFSISDAERALMLQVDEAIRRVGEGTYANCANCGNSIARSRLEAVPWARYCISCQELLEQGMLSEG